MWYAGRPDRAVSTDDTRPAWTRVYLHVPKAPKGKDAVWMGTLDATDAYQAVTLPVHFNDQDAPAAGAYECPSEAFKCKKSDPDLVFDAKALTLTRGEQTFHVRKAGASGVQPIDVAKLKNGEESTWEVGFNVDLLKKAAAGLDEPVVAVRFTLDANGQLSGLRPIILRPIDEVDKRLALLMPVRLKEAS